MIKSLYSLVLLSLLVLGSCKDKQKNETTEEPAAPAAQTPETFKEADPAVIDSLNNLLAKGTLVSDDDIMQAYAPKDKTAEGKYSYTITRKEITKDQTELTLIEEGLMDDSRAAQKVIISLTRIDGQTRITSIWENYKCQSGRGHETWSAEPCQ